MTDSLWSWLGFNLFVLALLALDLGVFHRRAREISFREALVWSAFWIVLALAWAAGVWHLQAPTRRWWCRSSPRLPSAATATAGACWLRQGTDRRGAKGHCPVPRSRGGVLWLAPFVKGDSHPV